MMQRRIPAIRANRRKVLATLTALTAGVSVSPVLAQNAWPERVVKIVVGYAPGGGADIAARLMARELSEELGQPFVVENRPGAANNIAAESVSRAAADGYTLLLSIVSSAINQSLYKNLAFDFAHDFEHIAKVSEGGFFLLVPPESPVNTVAELVGRLRAAPDKYFFASSGIGTSIHATGEMFLFQSATQATHVPYRGSSLALPALMAGDVDFMFDNSALPHIQAGKVRALAVTTRERSPWMPDIPTLRESGYPAFESTWWYGLSAPKGMSPYVVQTLNAALMRILQKPSVRTALMQMGEVPAPNTPAQFADFVHADIERWRQVVEAAGMSAD